ncbi:MAG: hypothetical protein AAF413_02565 [Patescibacteria group bacterium]
MKKISKKAYHLLQNISLGAIVGFLLLSLIGSIYGLRQNSLRMVELRDAVYAADRDDGDVDKALRELGSHVVNHMNTDLNRTGNIDGGEKPIQLVYSYYRDTLNEYQRITTDSSPEHVALLGRATSSCQETPIAERLSCIGQYVSDNAGPTYPSIEPLPKDFYVFDFNSPSWSPDLAGISLFMFGFSIVLLALRFITGAMASRIISYRN